MNSGRTLAIEFDPRTLQHLGAQMYGGGLVKPVAELIANAWDAEATVVEVQLPSTDKPVAAVSDNGHGMSWEDCQTLYLRIGQNRRLAMNGALTRNGARSVMGRKGLGKLAVIQVSTAVEVETVANVGTDVAPEFWLTRFRIPYHDFLAGDPENTERLVETLADEPAPDTLTFPGGSRTGTRTTLQGIRLGRMPNREQFIDSMHLRFAVATDTSDFRVFVDGHPVPSIEEAIASAKYEFFYDGAESIDGAGSVTWWLGFSHAPQTRDEHLGIGVYARGRLAVERPFYFNLTKGFTGQLSKEYMTGGVTANFLDEHEDLIATDRGSVDWTHPFAGALERWGQELIRKHAAAWEVARGKRKLDDLKPNERLMEQIRNLSTKPRNEAEVLLARLANLPYVTQEDVDRTARVLLGGLQHQEFLDALAALNAANVEGLPEVLDQWQILEALLYLPVVKSRLDVIRKLEELVANASPEFPDLFNHLRNNPELLRPEWQPLTWNQWMSTIVAKVFESRVDSTDLMRQKRPDVLCLSDSKRFVVVELKRPGTTVSTEEVNVFLSYMRRIQDEVRKHDDWKDGVVEGLLIADKLEPDAEFLLEKRNDVERKSWLGFLEEARRSHGFILNRIADRVDPDDPRAEPYLPSAGD